MKSRDKIITVCVCLAVLLLSAGGFLPCIWRKILGIPCPGCGMSRAYTALLAGDIRTAFAMHPLFFAPPVILALCLLKKGIAGSAKFWLTVGTVFAGVYILRMAIGFPGSPPMDYQPDNLLKNFIERIITP